MKIPGKNKAARAGIRLSVPLLIVLLVLVVSVLIIYSTPVLTEEKRTCGNLTFTDGAGIPVSGTIEISMTGVPGGSKQNVNTITWRNAPNAWIYFDAHDTKSVSINLRISGDSPYGRVSLEDHGAAVPGSADVPAPGVPVKYVELHSTGVTFADADISIYYTDAELKGADENSLVIYGYDGSSWNEVPTRVDAARNAVSATVKTLSVFAVSARADEEKLKEFRELINPPEVRETLEVDALKIKGVAVKLKLNKRGGEIKIEDHGKKNPVAVKPPGNVIKFVDISAENISFESAEVRIHYTDEELGGGNENALVIYHWNGAAWDALSTSVDAANNMLTAATTSLSPFAVSATGGVQTLIVQTSRYSVFSPWTGKPSSGVLSTDFMAYALLMGTDGMPDPGENITFEIYSQAVKKATLYDITKSNGLANVSYDTISDFTTSDDADYGVWNITAYLTNDTGIRGTTYMDIEAGGNTISGCSGGGGGGGGGGSQDNCHSTSTYNAGGYPLSPYTQDYGQTSTRAEAAHAYSKMGNPVHDNYGCYYCHPGYSPNNKTGSYGNTSDVHRNRTCDYCHGNWAYISGTGTGQGKGIPKMPSCYDCHPTFNNNMTNISTLANLAAGNNISVYSYNYDQKAPLTGHNGTDYSYNQSVPCVVCHGPAHNITKPELIPANTNNVTEYTQCTSCHNAYNRHNDGVSCTVCHSQDAHVIKVFAQNATYMNGSTSSFRGNCTSCHQNSTFMNTLLLQPKAGSYSGSAPQVTNPVRHSNDESAGKKWDNYWTNGTYGSAQLSSCKYCHGETLHKTSALGRPSLWKGNNTVNSTIGNTTWCSSCHWQGYANGTNAYSDMVSTFTGDSLSVPPEISGNASYGANQSIYEYTNHSLYTSFYSNLNDSACNRCHGYNYGFNTITRLVHNQSRVGGANCVDCHDLGGIALVAHVNVTATNDNNEIHKNLNSVASVSNGTAYYANNKRCWACHGNANESSLITNNHTTNYKTPRKCADCHLPPSMGGGNHNQGIGCICHFNIPYPLRTHLWNGTAIITPAATTCYDCHNKTEMLVYASDPDAGSGAVYGGANGGNNSTSHYGLKRTDMRIGGSANCSYCHQNTSTAFSTAMIDPSYNSSISNHSLRYNNSNPGCISSQCHNTGLIHSSTLTKPGLTLPNSTYCTSCHGSSGGATINNLTKHNNSVDCSSCHLYTARDIHPVKYLQPNASYNTSNSTAVNCTNCHQTGLAGFLNVPMVPNPMHHSDNATNGTIWNSSAYWTPASPLTACIYCHNDTKHNATALGRPANWQGSNIVNSSLSTGTWCASCHYRNYSSGGKNYSDMTQAFTSSNLSVPPEITNGSYAFNIYNRSNYYNHSLKDYSDAVCILCHGVNLSSSTTISAFQHNITWGSCTSCHYSFEAMNNTTRPDRYVDFSMYNTSLHRNLSCTNCHTQGHRNIGARKACEDCHAVQANPITDKDRHNITATPGTYSVGGNNVVGITDCTVCHDSALYNRSISTYGYWKQKDCDYCHTYPDKYYE